jgi:hypothetical protein
MLDKKKVPCDNSIGSVMALIRPTSKEEKGPVQTVGNAKSEEITEEGLMKQILALKRKKTIVFAGEWLGGVAALGGYFFTSSNFILGLKNHTELNVVGLFISIPLLVGGIKLTLYSTKEMRKILYDLARLSKEGAERFGNPDK